jgi:hypothetical protein
MIKIEFEKWRDDMIRRDFHRVLIEGVLQIQVDDSSSLGRRGIPSDDEMKQRLLSALSKELNGGIRDTLVNVRRAISTTRGSSKECDMALSTAQAEIHSVIQLLDSGMHLLRIDKMLTGEGN